MLDNILIPKSNSERNKNGDKKPDILKEIT